MNVATRVYIGDQLWRIRRVNYPRDRDGDCNWTTRTIRLHQNLHGLELLDTLLHELLHARFPDLAEEAVEDYASTAAAIAHAARFRQPDDEADE